MIGTDGHAGRLATRNPLAMAAAIADVIATSAGAHARPPAPRRASFRWSDAPRAWAMSSRRHGVLLTVDSSG